MKISGTKMMFIGLFVSLAITSCHKDKIELPESNDPVFTASGSFGGESFAIVAGDEGAYMYTMTLEENGVDIFTGRISDGNFSLEMGIYDGHIDQPGYPMENELINFTPQFADSSQVPMLILSKELLTSLPQSQFIETINWYIDGNWIGDNDAVISNPGKYEVCANIHFFGGTQQQLCNEVIVGYERHGNCGIDFTVSGQGALVASVHTSGSQLQSVKWFMDGQWISDASELFYNLSSDFSVLSAEITLQNGVKRIRRVLVNGSQTYLTSNDFSIFEENTPLGFSVRDLNFIIKVRKNGIDYTSMGCDNSNSTITISSVEFYGTNDQGNPVYKFTGNVNAKVLNTSTQNVVPISFSTTFGIEIK